MMEDMEQFVYLDSVISADVKPRKTLLIVDTLLFLHVDSWKETLMKQLHSLD